ncbi:MAG: HAMP domain-containing protein [bacterium]|nr:HAMP domain-containing protein [bacterium]
MTQTDIKQMNFFTRMMRQFFVRTFLVYAGIILLVFLSVYYFAQGTIREFYHDNLKLQLNQVGYALTPNAIELYKKKDFAGMDGLAKEVGGNIAIRITIIAPDGAVIADSQKAPGQMENHGKRPEVIKAFNGEIEESIRYSNTMQSQMLYLAMPVKKNGETGFVIRLSLFLRDIKNLEQNLRKDFTAILLLLFVVALVLAWFSSRGFSKPVREIVTATREFASGNFDVKIFTRKKDELGEVADSFNNMVVDQKNLFEKLSYSRERLQTIISSMTEGLLVLTKQGRISMYNGAFEKMIAKQNLEGQSYWETMRIPNFESYVEKAFNGCESFYQELEINNKIYQAGFVGIARGSELLVTFRDITGFKQLEKMKKDFIVNLTHELKTPLTAIKGFVETLEEEEDIENTHYIEIIKRHTHRMNLIVSDLLVLSELEEKGKKDVPMNPLKIDEVLDSILTIFREKIENKNIQLALNIEQDLPQIEGEQFKLEQMFINLFDNAVKYTSQEKGKITVNICSKAPNAIEIQFNNNGLPIPAKCLPRLFERFYVVDKSRSRKLGGTGLGLSIVKHVVLLHNGKISAKSSKTKGTTFTITLPTQN